MLNTHYIQWAAEQSEFSFGNPMLQLNEFVGIEIPAAVTFIPQTWGWWLMVSVVILLLAVNSYMRIRHWLQNRYRKQAVKRVMAAKDRPLAEFSAIVLKEIKQAISIAYGASTMVVPSNISLTSSLKGIADNQANNISLAALDGHALLLLLDITAEHHTRFNSPLGDAWQLSLLSKIEAKDAIAIEKNLTQQCCIWLMHHSSKLPCCLVGEKENADA